MKLVGLLIKEDAQAAMISGLGQGGTGSAGMVTTAATQPENAIAILKEIDKKAKEAGVKLEDLVVVFKGPDNKPVIKQAKDITTGKGARRGSFWGLVVGLIMGGPLLGVLGGLAIGAIYGKSIDRGLPDKFIKDLSSALNRGQSAVLVLIHPEDYDRSIAYLRTFDATIYEADMDADTEEAVLKMAEDDQVQKAIGSEIDL
jgi:uncharacterized membrane protein